MKKFFVLFFRGLVGVSLVMPAAFFGTPEGHAFLSGELGIPPSPLIDWTWLALAATFASVLAVQAAGDEESGMREVLLAVSNVCPIFMHALYAAFIVCPLYASTGDPEAVLAFVFMVAVTVAVLKPVFDKTKSRPFARVVALVFLPLISLVAQWLLGLVIALFLIPVIVRLFRIASRATI